MEGGGRCVRGGFTEDKNKSSTVVDTSSGPGRHMKGTQRCAFKIHHLLQQVIISA